MRSIHFRNQPFLTRIAVCLLLAFPVHGATTPDNPGVTDCLCPEEVQIEPELETNEEGSYKLKASKDGTYEFEVIAVPPSTGNPPTPKLTLSHATGVIETVDAWNHTFTFGAEGIEAPIVLEVTVPCEGHGSGGKFCERIYFVTGCAADDCGSGGGTCPSGSGSPEGDVEPGSDEPFKGSIPTGSSSQGDETTGLHFNASPDTAITINDFIVHSNGGYTRNGNVITTDTTVTTISGNSGLVTVSVTRAGESQPFKTFQFTSNTTGTPKTLTLVETSCGQDSITHQWTELSAESYSYSEANGMRVKYASVEADQSLVRIERHTVKELVGNTETTVSDEELHFGKFEWGTRLVQRIVNPGNGNANLTSTWTYGGPSDGLAYARLMQHTRPGGYVETHTYGTGYHQIDYAGGRQVKTEWSTTNNITTTTVTEKLGTIVVAKTQKVRDGTITTFKRHTDANNTLDTVTTYIA